MTPARMWSFYKNKRGGVMEALEADFPEKLKDPQLQAALTQVRSGLLLIDKVMTDAAEADDSDD